MLKSIRLEKKSPTPRFIKKVRGRDQLLLCVDGLHTQQRRDETAAAGVATILYIQHKAGEFSSLTDERFPAIYFYVQQSSRGGRPKISTPGKWRVLVQAPIDRGVFVLAVFLIYKLHYITEKRSKGIYHH